MPGSEIAQLRQRIADEYIAATQGLSGLAYGTTKHQFITHHMNAMGQHTEQLKELVGEEEAGRILIEVLEGSWKGEEYVNNSKKRKENNAPVLM